MNELIFLFHTLFIVLCTLGALWIGKAAQISLVILFAIFSNLFVTKQIIIFGLSATPTDAFTIGIVMSLNLLQEYYGKSLVQKVIPLTFMASVIYCILTQIHLWYVPSWHDSTQIHAQMLFGIMPRIMIASLFTYFVVQKIDSSIYEYLKVRYNDYYLFRNYGTVLFSQFLDTVMFSFLGLYGIVDSIGSLIIVSYSIKLLVIFIATPFLWFSRLIMNERKNYESFSL